MKALLFLRLVLALFAAGLGLVARAQPARAPAALDEKKTVIYKLTNTDRISISIVGEPDLNAASKRIDANGNINLSLVELVHLAGLTVAQAQTAIENAYRDGRILRNPQVTINIEEYAPRTVSISGMVKLPSTYYLPPEGTMTLKELVLKAGGLMDTANGSKVRISRKLPDGTLGTFYKDVDSILRSKNTPTAAEGNFVIEPDDNVFVPEKLI